MVLENNFFGGQIPFFQLWCKIVFGGVEELLTEVGSKFVRHTLLAVDHIEGLEEGCEKH